METLQELKNRREELRIAMRNVWQSGLKGTEYRNAIKEVDEPLKTIHQQILDIECADPALPQVRYTYSVCGYSEKHGYFREKHATFDELAEAKACFNELKNDPTWGIPTLIIQEGFLRGESPPLVDFEGPGYELGFSDTQEIIDKHMMGSREYRWKDLIDGYSRWTY
jgi:hypothetical protein